MIEFQNGGRSLRKSMANISIVTAFYDIGRGGWTPEKGLPHYLHRTTETYIERFSQLTKLENDITVFTTRDLVDQIKAACHPRENKVKVLVLDVFKEFAEMRERIFEIQKSEQFQKRVHPSQNKNPEYWNPDYVLVTNLKPLFPNVAIDNNLVENDMVAWIDFGYCRGDSNIPSSKAWNYNFDPEKIHLFNYKDYDGKPIENVVTENDVYVLGAKIVAHKNMWPKMQGLMVNSHYGLMKEGLVDDDQGLWLMSALAEPQHFQMHKIPDHQLGHDPFVLFNQFNDTL